MACVSFAPDKRFRMDGTHRNLDGTLLHRGEHFGVSLLRGGAADGGRVGFTARHGGVGGCLGGGFLRVGCALRPVPLAVVARHGFGNWRNTQLSKENSDRHAVKWGRILVRRCVSPAGRRAVQGVCARSVCSPNFNFWVQFNFSDPHSICAGSFFIGLPFYVKLISDDQSVGSSAQDGFLFCIR